MVYRNITAHFEHWWFEYFDDGPDIPHQGDYRQAQQSWAKQ
jgi:hypothetical protein